MVLLKSDVFRSTFFKYKNLLSKTYFSTKKMFPKYVLPLCSKTSLTYIGTNDKYKQMLTYNENVICEYEKTFSGCVRPSMHDI